MTVVWRGSCGGGPGEYSLGIDGAWTRQLVSTIAALAGGAARSGCQWNQRSSSMARNYRRR